MNKTNLEAIHKLFDMPPNASGINENFYWAIHGNWTYIRAVLEEHFAGANGDLKKQCRRICEGPDGFPQKQQCQEWIVGDPDIKRGRWYWIYESDTYKDAAEVRASTALNCDMKIGSAVSAIRKS